jgi:hypothetical protein
MRGLVVNLVKKIRDKKSHARAPLNKFHHFTARIKKFFLLKHEVFAFEPDISLRKYTFRAKVSYIEPREQHQHF